jgi:tetratricopeptide (TPR) repeat protein
MPQTKAHLILGSVGTQDAQLAQLYYNRGTAHEAAGRRAEAIADYSRPIELRPSFDDALLARGELYRQENRLSDARADLQLALRYADDDRSRAVAKTRLAQLGLAPERRCGFTSWTQLTRARRRQSSAI